MGLFIYSIACSLFYERLYFSWFQLGPGKKKHDFSWKKTLGSFSQNRDFFPEHKNREKRGYFTKSMIYRDQKSKKLPNDRHNERAVVRILIENGAEIRDNSALPLAWHWHGFGTVLSS